MSTNAQYDSQLETLAQLIEAKAKTIEEAANIVRNAKTASKATQNTGTDMSKE